MLCYVLGLVPHVAFRGLVGFLVAILHMTGSLTQSLHAGFLEHRVGCDRFSGVSTDVGFSLCHLDRRVDSVLLGIVLAKSDV